MATSYPVSRRLFAIAAKVQAVADTPVVPTFVTNALRTIDRPELTRDFLNRNSRETWFTGGLGELAAISPGGEWHQINCSFPIVGTGAAYASTAAPPIDPLLRAAGYAAVYTTGSVDYTPTDNPATQLSVYTRLDGKEYHTINAIVTDWSITAEAGAYAQFNCAIVGAAGATAVSEVDIGAVTLPTVVPPRFVAATVAVSAYNPVIRSFELAGGNTHASRGDGRATAGHAGFRITRRQPEYRPVVEHADITDFNPEGDWTAATQRTLDMTIGAGGADHNTFGIDADDLRVIDFPPPTDEDGLVLVEPVYRIFTPSSGTELEIKFT